MTGKDSSGKITIVVAIIGVIGVAISAFAFYYGADRAAQEVIINATATAKSVTEQTQIGTPSVQTGEGDSQTKDSLSATQSTSKVASWQRTTFLPESLSRARSLVYNNRIYIIGGMVSDGLSNKVFYTQLADDGSLGDWKTASGLPRGLQAHAAIIHNDHIYVIGGIGERKDLIQDVNYALISHDGTLGSWQRTTALPIPIGAINHAVAIYNDAIYIVGGYNGSNHLNTVYQAFVKSKEGELSSWTSISNLPNPISYASVTIFEDKLYILGGLTENNSIVSSVFHAKINDRDGSLGEWVTDTSKPKKIWGETVLVQNNRLYVIGGYLDNSTISREIFYATVSKNNALEWKTAQRSLPFELAELSAVFSVNRLYIIGGANSGANQDRVYFVEID